MKALVIGTGAAGNKAVIGLVEKGIISAEDIVLFNTTMKDIPDTYRENAIQIPGSLGGCGQERSFGQELILKALKEQNVVLDGMYNPEHKMVIVIASTGGGTGSGSAPVIARYFSSVVKVRTHLIGFTGFAETGRELENTVSFMKDIVKDFTVHLIDNGKFMKEAKGNQLQAEKMANLELAARVSIMTGKVLVDSEQNIDDTDLYKLINTPGYEEICYKVIDDKIKTEEQFASIIKDMISGSKSIDVTKPSQMRMGAIFNIPESEHENVDFGLEQVKEKYGMPFESFKHIQYVPEMPRFIAFVCSGIKLPIEEIEDIQSEYEKASSKVSKDSDEWFTKINSINSNSEDHIFNFHNAEKELNSGSKDDFFSSFETK